MDGTLAEFKKVDTLEKLYEKGYFLNLEPHMNVVDAIRSIVTDHSEIEVYILSAVLSDSPYAVTEKMPGSINIFRKLIFRIDFIRIVEQTRKSFLKESLEVLVTRIFCLMIIPQIYTHGNHQQRELSL